MLATYVRSVLGERFDPRRVARHLARDARGWDHLAASLPADIQGILELIRSGRLGVDFRVHDPDGAIDHLVDGLVAGASMLAAAQLIGRRTGPLVGGVSAPGLVAAGIGVLSWQRLVHRRHEHRSWVTMARELAETREGPSPRDDCRFLASSARPLIVQRR